MNNFYARSVFFVKSAERALRFYVEQLGFAEDWNYREEGRTFVCQVSLFGFELILNETHGRTEAQAGHGRVFIGLDDDQGEPLRKHIEAKAIQTERVDWGRPTLLIRDLDGNELLFWVPNDNVSGFGVPALEPSTIAAVESSTRESEKTTDASSNHRVDHRIHVSTRCWRAGLCDAAAPTVHVPGCGTGAVSRP